LLVVELRVMNLSKLRAKHKHLCRFLMLAIYRRTTSELTEDLAKLSKEKIIWEPIVPDNR
jgi:hypothetical protein